MVINEAQNSIAKAKNAQYPQCFGQRQTEFFDFQQMQDKEHIKANEGELRRLKKKVGKIGHVQGQVRYRCRGSLQGQKSIYNLEKQVAEVVEINPDRKSTRLNSSHVKISYADFCL